MGGDRSRRRVHAGELPGGEGAHIGLHDGMLRDDVDPVAAGDNVDGHRGLFGGLRQPPKRQRHAGGLQGGVAAVFRLQARMGGAAGEVHGQGRGALARHQDLVGGNAPFQVDHQVAVSGHGADQVARARRADLFAGVEQDVDPREVSETDALESCQGADDGDGAGLVVARSRTEIGVPFPMGLDPRRVAPAEHRVHVRDHQDAALARAGQGGHDIVAR